jgi:predicted RNA binding protein YcfA (HicA-like mRNA interferase family)
VKPVSGKDFARLLERNGWELRRVNGSHHIYAKAGSVERISVPIHGNTPLKSGLLRYLMKVAGIGADELRAVVVVMQPFLANSAYTTAKRLAS